MTKVLPFLGNTELEVLSVVGSLLLVLTHCATAYSVKEKVVVGTKYAYMCLICVLMLIRWSDRQTKESGRNLRRYG